MKENLFDLILKIENSCPNDFEFGNLVRRVIDLSEKNGDDADLKKIVEEINRTHNKNIKF
jgi:hypothetical protein